MMACLFCDNQALAMDFATAERILKVSLGSLRRTCEITFQKLRLKLVNFRTVEEAGALRFCEGCYKILVDIHKEWLLIQKSKLIIQSKVEGIGELVREKDQRLSPGGKKGLVYKSFTQPLANMYAEGRFIYPKVTIVGIYPPPPPPTPVKRKRTPLKAVGQTGVRRDLVKNEGVKKASPKTLKTKLKIEPVTDTEATLTAIPPPIVVRRSLRPKRVRKLTETDDAVPVPIKKQKVTQQKKRNEQLDTKTKTAPKTRMILKVKRTPVSEESAKDKDTDSLFTKIPKPKTKKKKAKLEGNQEQPISPNLDHSPIKSQESEVNTEDLDLISPPDKVKPKPKLMLKASLRREIVCKVEQKDDKTEDTDLDDCTSEDEGDFEDDDSSSEDDYSLDSDLERLPNDDNSGGKVEKVEEWIENVRAPRNAEKEYLSHQDTSHGVYRVPYNLDPNLTTKKLNSDKKLDSNGKKISDNYNGGPPYAVVKIEPLDMPPPLPLFEGIEAQ